MSKRVFLGGTVNGSNWRKDVKSRLKIDFFDPEVAEWNEDAYKKELQERDKCDFCLYVITPQMTGVYSIAELIDDSNKRPQKTVYCIIEEEGGKQFSPHQIKALKNVGRMVEKNGAKWFENLDKTVDFLNKV